VSPLLRNLTPLAACLGLALLAGTPSRAAPKPLTSEEQAKVDRAIEKGIAFLKSTQREEGGWPDKDHALPRGIKDWTKPLGYALLPGLALLESGVPADDLCVQKVADLLRRNTAKLNQTYGVSLAVLFLDRLGDAKDEELVRDLALRLIAFQGYSGGWGYRCPKLSKKSRDDLWKTLHDLPEGEATGPAGRLVPPAKVPPTLRQLALFRPPAELLRRVEPLNKQYLLYVGTTDNSNTQFALLALWAARRHGVPVEWTMRLASQRFRLTQQRDGTWSYYYPAGGWRSSHRSSRSMTTVGLLGLAVGHGLVRSGDKAVRGAIRDPQIERGFAALARHIGGQLGDDINLYFLWTLERVGVLYNQRTIQKKDWYAWGARRLLERQGKEGEWGVGGYHESRPIIDTCFALLFLKRANLTHDLSRKLEFFVEGKAEQPTSPQREKK
jgi:hypothetical protein